MDIRDRLADFIRARFEVGDDPEFDYDAHLFDMGFVDSMGAVEIITFCEDTWGIEITQRDLLLLDMNTVNEIAAVVEGKL